MIEKEYPTSNINIISWLLSAGYSYNRVETENNSTRKVFYFNDTENIRKEIDDFYKNDRLKTFLMFRQKITNQVKN